MSKKSNSDAVILSRDTPHKSAQLFHAARYPTAMRYGEDWLVYKDGAYRMIDDKEVEAAINDYLIKAEVRYAVKQRDVENMPIATTPFNPKNADVDQVVKHMQRQFFKPRDTYTPPCFLEGIGSEFDGVNPRNLISCQNAIVDITTRKTYAPTDRFFTMTALPIDYSPEAACPLWEAFLGQVLQGNVEMIRLMQQIFGNLITDDMSHEKIYYLRGRPRSGKGTTMHIMDQLVGPKNVSSPTLGDIAERSGREGLLGKRLLKVPELNADNRNELSTACSILNSISGRDVQHIFRKYKSPLNETLPLHIVLAGNQFPDFGDHATALAARLLVISFDVSFEGRADPALKEKLTAELAGILNWALVGLADLRADGKFIEPAAAKLAKSDVLNSGNPIRGFVREQCELGAAFSCSKDELFDNYRDYCKAISAHPLSKDKFSSKLTTAFPDIAPSRPRTDGEREHVFLGVRPRDASSPLFVAVRYRLDPDLITLLGCYDPATYRHAILRDAKGRAVEYCDDDDDFGA